MKKGLYLLFAFFIAIITRYDSHAQGIITVAGLTTEGYLGDSGLAVGCHLHWPEAIALDATTSVYIADADNNVIRKIDAVTGIITTVVGSGFEAGTGTGGFSGDGGPASAARLFYPSGLAFDGSGNMYIADQKNNRIRMVNGTSGIITTIAGDGIANFMGDGAAATAAELSGPTRVTVNAAGIIYIADAGNHCIRKIVGGGVISTVAGTGGAPGYSGDGGPAISALLHSPQDMTVDPSGNIFIADYVNNRIRKVDAGGNISTVAGFGTPGFSGDSAAATAANIFEPSGIVSDAAGNIFFSDFANARVRRIDGTTGIITTFAGNGTNGYSGDGGPARSAELFFPEGLAMSVLGGVYIADKANNRVRYASTTLQVSPVTNAAGGLKVYPNPNDGAFTISVTSATDEPVQVTVTNVTGQKVYSFDATTNTAARLKLDAPPGVYILSAVTAHGIFNEKVFVK